MRDPLNTTILGPNYGAGIYLLYNPFTWTRFNLSLSKVSPLRILHDYIYIFRNPYHRFHFTSFFKLGSRGR